MLRRMKLPEQPVTLPLDYATELAVELHLMRGECSDAARELIQEATEGPVDEIGLEECAVLDEALARAHRHLQAALDTIRQLRAARGGI